MASGIRTLQRNAINKMLDLNRDGASDDSKNWNDPWKILVYDAFGRDIISPLLLVADLRKRGITLHLLLDSEREQIADVPAIYFVQPTAANVKRLGQDCARALYHSSFARGAERQAALSELQGSMKTELATARALALQVNSTRDAIGATKTKIEEQRVKAAVASVVDGTDGAGGGGGGGAVDEEEVRLCATLVQQKDAYRGQAAELKRLKAHCAALQARAEAVRSAADAEFERWWALMKAQHGMGEAGGAPPPPRAAWAEESAEAADDPPAAAEAAAESIPEDAEAALALFKERHWPAAKAARREAKKRELSEEYASAKEAGATVARKRASVAALREQLAAAAEGGGGEQEEEALRARLALDTGLYRDAVAQLKELKPKIEGLQAELARDQQKMLAEFEAWWAKAAARPAAKAVGAPRERKVLSAWN